MDNLNVTNYSADVVTKKKKPGVIIGVAAAVLVGGSGVAYAAVPVVHNTVNMAVMSPEKYCIDVYENSIDKCFKEYDEKTEVGKKLSGGNFKFTFEPDSDSISLVESQLGNELFDKISISVDAKTNDSSVSGKVLLSADDKEVASANYLGFSESGKIYAQVPGLSEKYLYADCNELLGEDFSETYKNILKKADPEIYNDYKELLETYSKDFIKIIPKGTSELEKGIEGKVADVNYKYNQVTTVLKADDINPFIQDFTNKIKNDQKIKDLCENIYGKSLTEEIFNNISDSSDIEKVEKDVTVKTYIDAEGTIRGIDLNDGVNQLGFVVAKDGKNIGFELQCSNKAVVSLKAVQSGDSYTGTLTTTGEYEDSDQLVINFENFEVVDDMYINGSISTDLSEFTDDQFNNLSLSFNATENGQNVSTEIPGVGKFSVDLSTSNGDQQGVEEPEDAVSVEDIDQYLEGVDTRKYLDETLGKLGLTYEQVESLVQGIQSIYGMSNYSDDYEYDFDDDDFNYDDDLNYDDDFNYDDDDFNFDDTDFSFDDSDINFGDADISYGDQD